MDKQEISRRLQKALDAGLSMTDLALGAGLVSAIHETTMGFGKPVPPADAMLVGVSLGLALASEDPEAGDALYRVITIMTADEDTDPFVQKTVPFLLQTRRERLEEEHAHSPS